MPGASRSDVPASAAGSVELTKGRRRPAADGPRPLQRRPARQGLQIPVRHALGAQGEHQRCKAQERRTEPDDQEPRDGEPLGDPDRGLPVPQETFAEEDAREEDARRPQPPEDRGIAEPAGTPSVPTAVRAARDASRRHSAAAVNSSAARPTADPVGASRLDEAPQRAPLPSQSSRP